MTRKLGVMYFLLLVGIFVFNLEIEYILDYIVKGCFMPHLPNRCEGHNPFGVVGWAHEGDVGGGGATTTDTPSGRTAPTAAQLRANDRRAATAKKRRPKKGSFKSVDTSKNKSTDAQKSRAKAAALKKRKGPQ